ncbi:MAG: 30S ribosomal protein S5 [Legionellaceae bacterium]|nr:30S ribosomal protein S5 [Legionellaceae bacterium]
MASEDTNKQEGLKDRVVSVRRVTKVVKGGRKFAFSASVVVGDGKGRVGFGRGKSGEVPLAIQKATEQARKNMSIIPLAGTTIHQLIVSNFGASRVFMKPARKGTGIIAGGAMRAVFEVLGVEDICAKSIGSSNPNNVVRATVDALKKIGTPDYVAAKRGKTISEIMG